MKAQKAKMKENEDPKTQNESERKSASKKPKWKETRA